MIKGIIWAVVQQYRQRLSHPVSEKSFACHQHLLFAQFAKDWLGLVAWIEESIARRTGSQSTLSCKLLKDRAMSTENS